MSTWEKTHCDDDDVHADDHDHGDDDDHHDHGVDADDGEDDGQLLSLTRTFLSFFE